MGEQHDPDQRRPSTGKRPSPNSVKELLDIVHLQQSGPLNTGAKQDADVLSSRGVFNPLPAIGQGAGSFPPVANASPAVGASRTAATGDELVRPRSNSDGCHFQRTEQAPNRHGSLLTSLENGGTNMPSIHSPRDVTHQPVPSATVGRPTQQRRERILPPLSEHASTERAPSRTKMPLRRTSSGEGNFGAESIMSNHGHGDRMLRPKSAHGRRRPLPSEIIAIHESVPPPYDEEKEVFTLDTVSPRSRGGAKPAQDTSDRPPNMMARPKSSKGRTRQGTPLTSRLSQGDDWSSEEDTRPRAPSPPSPGLDSDLDSGPEACDDNNGRNNRPR